MSRAGRLDRMSNKALSRVLEIVDALSLVAMAVVATQVVPEAEAAGTVPQEATIAFAIGCVPLVYVAVVAWRLFASIGRGETFVRENASRLRRMGAASAASAAVWAACIVLCVVAGGGSVGLSSYSVLSVALIFCVALCIVCVALALLTGRAADIKDENDMTV